MMMSLAKRIFASLALGAALFSTTLAQANTPFTVGRLLKEPAADLKIDTTKTLTGLACTWTCAESAQKAAEFGANTTGVVPGLVAYTGEISNCSAPDKTVATTFKGCCRGQPYNDWGVVANGVVNGQKVRAVLPCGGR